MVRFPAESGVSGDMEGGLRSPTQARPCNRKRRYGPRRKLTGSAVHSLRRGCGFWALMPGYAPRHHGAESCPVPVILCRHGRKIDLAAQVQTADQRLVALVILGLQI